MSKKPPTPRSQRRESQQERNAKSPRKDLKESKDHKEHSKDHKSRDDTDHKSRRSDESRDHKTRNADDFLLECKAAYLTVFDDLTEEIRSKSELQMVMQQTGRNPTQKVLATHWTRDTRRLDFDDFCSICRKERVTSEDDLMRAFRRIDVNGDGYITFDELAKTMTQRGEKMSRDEVEQMISEVDENHDGKLNYKEFAHLVLSTASEVKKLARQKMERVETKKSSSSSKDKRERPTSSPRSTRREENGVHHEGKASIRTSSPLSPTESPKPKPRPRAATRWALLREKLLGKSGEENGVHHEVNGSGQTSSPLPPTESLKPKPRPRSATRSTGSAASDDGPKPQPRPRREERPKSPVATKKVRLPEPRTLREWRCLMKKGVLHLDEDGSLTSHKYRLTLTESTDVWITVQPKPIHPDSESSKAPLDVAVLILNESTEKVVTLSEQRDNKGKYCLRCDLQKGKYLILPFSTGCRLRKRKGDPKSTSKLVKKEGDSYVLTRPFREALLEIFEISDLDGNSLLSREEFNLYNLRTSGEPVQDEEWEVVEENIELKDGQITMKGFVQLNEMEAEDNEGDTQDLWVTLNSMGYNKALVVDEACPFAVHVYVEEDDGARLEAVDFTQRQQVDEAITHIIMNKGDGVKMSKEATLFVYCTDYLIGYVLENKSRSKQVAELDFTKSLNCVSSQDSLETRLAAPSKGFSAPLFVMPQNERLEWTVRCKETLV